MKCVELMTVRARSATIDTISVKYLLKTDVLTQFQPLKSWLPRTADWRQLHIKDAPIAVAYSGYFITI